MRYTYIYNIVSMPLYSMTVSPKKPSSVEPMRPGLIWSWSTICCRNYCRPRCAEKTGDEGGEIMRTHQLMVSIPWTNLYFLGGVEKRILLVVDFETIHSDQNSSSCTVEIWNWSSHINSRQNVVSSSCQNRCELVLVLCTLEWGADWMIMI